MPADMAQVPDMDTLTAARRRHAPSRPFEDGLVARDRGGIHVVLTPAGHEVLGRAIAAQGIDHRLTTPLDASAVLTAAPIKIVGSDRSEDNRNRIHINKVIAYSACSVRR